MPRVFKYLFLCSVFICALNLSAQAQLFFEEGGLIGKAAPDFTLSTVKDKAVNFTEFRGGQNAIVFFWATWCPHCREQLIILNQKKDEIQKSGIKLVMVDLGESKEVVEKYLKQQKFDFNPFIDENEDMGNLYQLIGVPTLIFVSQDGMIKSIDHQLPDDIVGIFK